MRLVLLNAAGFTETRAGTTAGPLQCVQVVLRLVEPDATGPRMCWSSSASSGVTRSNGSSSCCSRRAAASSSDRPGPSDRGEPPDRHELSGSARRHVHHARRSALRRRRRGRDRVSVPGHFWAASRRPPRRFGGLGSEKGGSVDRPHLVRAVCGGLGLRTRVYVASRWR